MKLKRVRGENCRSTPRQGIAHIKMAIAVSSLETAKEGTRLDQSTLHLDRVKAEGIITVHEYCLRQRHHQLSDKHRTS
jgi:hypothetical protein